ncbi:Polycomb complex protein BMI-1 [Zostera marina]|uniref:Polycomb complex protein BMI-1 n=1 Tax=Zostera marina TaxID=29655 RepID=A0A0K9Q051_ZOSMR|nr:Polycomb complex protein BMI-1 [Zostera marina]
MCFNLLIAGQDNNPNSTIPLSNSGGSDVRVKMSSLCPFSNSANQHDKCPVKHNECQTQTHTNEQSALHDMSTTVPAKCPFGYDSQSFKLGPLSCVICEALLFESSKSMPCSHKYCKFCISRFNDCPICGADIESIEPDVDLQNVVNRFIEGHCRIKRFPNNKDSNDAPDGHKDVVYGDISLERGAFLVQQAMRAFRAQNIESAKSRLSLCADDIRDQVDTLGSTSDLCSQLGAVLGMLGDCCRTKGDSGSAVSYYEESVSFLSKLNAKDLEVVHTLSVSLNKIGDLKYYEGDLQSARSYYVRSLDFRRNATKEYCDASSQILDVATSLAKVADVDRSLGDEKMAVSRFEEAIKCLESLKLKSDEVGLEMRKKTVLEFLNKQLEEK